MSTWRLWCALTLTPCRVLAEVCFGVVPSADGNGDWLLRVSAHIIKSEYPAAKLNRLGWCFKGNANSWAERKNTHTRARMHACSLACIWSKTFWILMREQTVYAAFFGQEKRCVYYQKQTFTYLNQPWERSRKEHWSRGAHTLGLLPPSRANPTLLSSPAAPSSHCSRSKCAWAQFLFIHLFRKMVIKTDGIEDSVLLNVK